MIRRAQRAAFAAPVLLALSCAASSCGPRERPPLDVTARHAWVEPTPRNPLDAQEAKRIETLWKISMAEIARPDSPATIVGFAGSTDPSVRTAAAVALGRAGEALASAGGDAKPFVDALLPLATDKSNDVRGAAAFAVGLIGEAGHARIEAPFAVETAVEVRAKWVRAAGRVAPLPPPQSGPVMVTGTAGAAVEEMALLATALGDDALAEPAAWALGVYGMRCERGGTRAIVPAATLAALRSRFQSTAGAAREPFAYALWRLKQVTTTGDLRLGLSDPDPRVRAWCARGLGAVSGSHAGRDVARLLRDSNVWTRVEAARAMAKLGDQDSTSAVELVDMLERADPPRTVDKGLAAANPHAAVAALEALGELRVRATADSIFPRLGTDDPYLFAAVASAWIKVDGPEGVDELAEVLTHRGGPASWRLRKSIADALANVPPTKGIAPDPATPADAFDRSVPSPTRDLLASLLADPDVRVRGSALDSYAEIAGAGARSRLVAAITTSNDVAIVGTAGDRLAALDDPGPDAAKAVVDALARFTARDPDIAASLAVDAAKIAKEAAVPALEAAARSPDNALMLAADKALRSLKRVPPARTATPAQALPLADFTAALDLTRATLRTPKGDVKIALRPDVAPLTVWHLAQLASHGYFRGLAFHRVVPAFVAQGGDPRSDGAGGSGASIPCELSDLAYDRGVLGMALAGRDTGDSQFFFTLTPQPHLEENYTVVGHVLHGQDVLDALEVADPIDDLTFP
ncbi:MAG TPA: peptidylprolyl isomerase [bacterium]|nr:peptidylprolyl isomerase [bacterium]